MSGINKIKERILEEARLQAEETVKRAEEEASEIINSAKKEAEELKKQIIDKANSEALEVKKRLKAGAELEARKQRLQAKQEVVEEAFSQAIKKLNSLPDDQYFSIIVDLIVNSASNDSGEIILSGRDKERLPSDFEEKVNKNLSSKRSSGNFTLSDETRDINGGFILKMGNVEINNSFDAIIRMKRNEIEADVIASLF
ncbi:V-type ATP synthase subunit E [Acetivibrio saccincola]|jgi:V/A-type H+-transporting ATPase subunit E|uniref:V-type proton ATPase subunit E n=1 Tax=Acetivibrio saccincola TaxID=1677857 RepID=A0A2K9DYK8_9FIRM|nr:V-type ATP synthase subunit E family protein [Acetivibrio saccincola]AUG56229.1 V-type ATP synthase subunit E [Acetivibrio saccincola]NLW26105.1 hypothetical protein [Acetivibrio saccincola]HOA97360.1 V-type ATP synthase subunit E family protein [Acetivibrio saccincola]HQD28112.1 V-type ATP synthase subunit E family protein [Acetivibrio saccincola]